MPSKPIYVEIGIRAPVETLWRLTQSPEEHQRWDARFSEIVYLPKLNGERGQRFRYSTRIGLGMRIDGLGETVGEHESGTGARSSSLRFWSDNPKSLISEGSGFWKYVPEGETTRFLTRYDYKVRFGFAGEIIDRTIFRPVMGWATAWSFDRLRIWAETGAPPEHSLRLALANLIARVSLAFAWFWHGLVPKLLVRHPDEAVMLTDAGISARAAEMGVLGAGIAELALALWLIFKWNSRAPLLITLVLMPLALIGVAIHSPRMIGAAFNPVTLNLFMCAAAGIALVTQKHVPSARRCLRVPTKGVE